MKRLICGLCIALSISATTPYASATSSVPFVPLTIDDVAYTIPSVLYQETTYISLRGFMAYFAPDATVTWNDGQAVVFGEDISLVARPTETEFMWAQEAIAVPHGVQLFYDYTMLPVRILAELFEVTVTWCDDSGTVHLYSKEVDTTETPLSPNTYTEEDLYWLSRIISAESGGESVEGQIAVGNVVLNRVSSPDFPNTIYDVIFDSRWGGQFEPVRNGTIYLDPTTSSIDAALRCLAGERVVDDSLYFLAPDLTDNHWIMENCDYVTTIGCHWFYR